MSFISFFGRVLFVSFVFSAWQEFNEFGFDGGQATKTLERKFTKFTKHITTLTGFKLPEFEINLLVIASIILKVVGSLIFIFGSRFGAFFLILHQLIATPILYDFYNYDMEKKAFTQLFIKFTQNLALLGGLVIFIGMKTSTQRQRRYVNVNRMGPYKFKEL
ncbi:uncharacterized protein LOC143557501 [Bidens hawaiensis]|uniref:uncharacterized protein LOC143557052 n=1 Tax=Bidens hawaiensis TaxID=980011 RepID=UPI00404B8819